MPAKTDKEHLEKLKQGDQASFKWVYDQYHEKVYGYCLKLVNSYPIAEEITGDVFVRLWEKRHILDTSFSISGLLFKITKDFVWNYLKRESRKNRKQSVGHLDRQTSSFTSVESDLILHDYLTIAECAIRQLPEKRQMVFNLRYKAGMDNREIARQLDISESTVRVHIMKATQFLKTYFKSHPEMPFFFFLHFFSLAL